jgi:BirA family transcriptional regulator, biotin operon repressor / biotin---[acetyl-CoA-carboxylase] ligase
VTSFGHPRRHYRLTSSTNDRARELAEAGAPSGTVVTADEQSAGRGRTGRRWSAPRGEALLASWILQPLGRDHALLPLAVPLAVCEAIEAVAPVRCQVKWPNDVWISERKVAGVLVEARPPDWAVIGVGVNVAVPDEAFAADLRWPATSVGHGVEVGTLLTALGERLERWVGAKDDDVLDAFADRDALRGRSLEWSAAGGERGEGAGVGGGIDERGNLVVETDAGDRIALGAGEVSLSISAPSGAP